MVIWADCEDEESVPLNRMQLKQLVSDSEWSTGLHKDPT